MKLLIKILKCKNVKHSLYLANHPLPLIQSMAKIVIFHTPNPLAKTGQ